MGHDIPGSQSRSVMARKREVVALLLQRGLTTSQIAAQARCSPFFVRRTRDALSQGDGEVYVNRG